MDRLLSGLFERGQRRDASGAVARDRWRCSPSVATAAGSWRRSATSTWCWSTRRRATRHRGAGVGAVVSAVGRPSQARPRRALRGRPARAGRRRSRDRDDVAQRPPAGRRRRARRADSITEGRARWRKNGRRWLDAADGRASSNAASRPVTSPTCSSRISRTVTAACATCRRCWWAGDADLVVPDDDLAPARGAATTVCSTSGSRCTGSTGRPGDVLRLEDQDAVAAAASGAVVGRRR